MWQWDELEIIAYQIHCDLGGIQFLQLEIAIQKVSTAGQINFVHT